MAQQLTPKAKPIKRNEVMLLLDLISKYKIIKDKATNAITNRLKDDAWEAVAKEFSVITGQMRRKEQLRIKWENMKKAARKRGERIREHLKNGREESPIPPDNTLDRVASLIGITRNDSTEECDSDTEETSETLYVVEAVPEMKSLSEPLQPEEKRRKKASEELQRAQKEKELAMAAYFRAMTEKVELEKVKLRLEIERLKKQ